MDRFAIVGAIKKAERGIQQYLEIMNLFPNTNVYINRDFQRKYNRFYRVRQRKKEFYDIYYRLMEDLKGKNLVLFSGVLNYLHERLGRYEPSFSSKLVATHKPNMPIWDSSVLKNTGFKSPPYNANDRLKKIVKVYDGIVGWHKNYLKTDEGKMIIETFDQIIKESSITDLKKIDFVLWQTR